MPSSYRKIASLTRDYIIAERVVDLADAEDETITLFEGSGMVEAQIYAIPVEDVVSSGTSTLQIGTDEVDDLFAAVSDADDLLEGTIWFDDTSPLTKNVSTTAIPTKVISNSVVTLKVGGDAITSGIVKFIARYLPRSDDGFLAKGGDDAYTAYPTLTVPLDIRVRVVTDATVPLDMKVRAVKDSTVSLDMKIIVSS